MYPQMRVRPEVAPPMNAKFFQIVSRQLRQDAQVDLVPAESVLVALKPASAASPHVHRVVPTRVLKRVVRAKQNAWEPMMRL